HVPDCRVGDEDPLDGSDENRRPSYYSALARTACAETPVSGDQERLAWQVDTRLPSQEGIRLCRPLLAPARAPSRSLARSRFPASWRARHRVSKQRGPCEIHRIGP